MNTTAGLQAEDFDTLDNILDDLRERFEETPQWEFCEGFMAALVCCRRAVPDAEWLPMLLGVDEGEEGGSFADDAQREQFSILAQNEARIFAALRQRVQRLLNAPCGGIVPPQPLRLAWYGHRRVKVGHVDHAELLD